METDTKKNDVQEAEANNEETLEYALKHPHDWGVFKMYLEISKIADELWGKPITNPPSV